MRRTPLLRNASLESRTPLARTQWIRPVPLLQGGTRITASRAGISPAAETPGSAPKRKPLKPVSARRRAENRQRRAMADRLWPDRREGTVMCGCGRPECQRPADDLHEPLSRARGGSITDEANAIPLARECHDEITFRPESELGWAYDLGLLVHSWDAPGGAA